MMRLTITTSLLVLTLLGAFVNPATARGRVAETRITLYDANKQTYVATLSCNKRPRATGFLAGRALSACSGLRRLLGEQARPSPITTCATRVYGRERATIKVGKARITLIRSNACEEKRWKRYRSLTRR